MALLVYTEKLNPRIIYVFEHIFTQTLGVDLLFSDNQEVFERYNHAKIAYTNQPKAGALSFKKHVFMDESDIRYQPLQFADWDGLKIPFPVATSPFSFDVFSATFYLLSRYEEYLISERDEHNRFAGKSSLAFKHGFLNRPVIDEWAYIIVDIIKKDHSDFVVKKRNFQFIPTLDIDRPYYYKTDSPLRRIVKMVLCGFQKDPFDIYQQVDNWDKMFKLKTVYFFLLGNKHEHDCSPGIANELYRSLIKTTNRKHQVGIHPSYFSSQHPNEVIPEKERLEHVAGKTIEISRQHYLMLSLPGTYRTLIAGGISADYTMAFADLAGFRASTCTPFFWYDLSDEKRSDLLLYPTAVMDQTLRRYMGLSAEEALIFIEELMKNAKAVNGTFISLWHNESINDFGVWKGWKRVYEGMLALGSKQ